MLPGEERTFALTPKEVADVLADYVARRAGVSRAGCRAYVYGKWDSEEAWMKVHLTKVSK